MSTRTFLRRTARIALAAALLAPAAAFAQLANLSVSVATPIPMGANPAAVAYSNAHGKVYVANRGSDTVSVYVPFGATKTIPIGHSPSHLAVNNATDTVYVANDDGTMTVIDAASDTVRNTQGVNVTGPMSVNTGTNHMFMVRQSAVDEVNVIVADNYLQTDATRSWAPVALATNLATNRLFVAHQSSSDIVPMNMNGDLVYPTRECPDGNGGLIPDTNPDPPACIRVPGYPVAVAVNPVTNRAYALSSTNEITVIQGPNMTFQTFTPPSAGTPRNPKTIAVDPVRNLVYAVYDQLVVVMDGNTNAMTTAFTPSGGQNVGIAVDLRDGVAIVPSDVGVLNSFIGDGHEGNRQATIPSAATGIVYDGQGTAWLASPQGLSRIAVSYGGTGYVTSPLHVSIRQPASPVSPNGSLTIDTSSDLPGIDFTAVYYLIRRHTNQTGDGWHKATRNPDGTWSAPIIDKEPSYGYTAYAFGVTGLEVTSINPENASLPLLSNEAETSPFTLQNVTGGIPPLVKSLRRRDANGDGRNDLFWSHTSGAQGVWLMNGLAPTPTMINGPAGASIAGFGDFDHDGRTDAIWNAPGSGVFTVTLLDGGTIRSQSSFAAPDGSSALTVWATGDFDGDGKTDILWGTDWGISFMDGTTPTTAFFYAPMAADELRETPVAVGDFNGDGRDEALFMGNDGQVDLVTFNRQGIASVANVRPPNTGFVPVAIGDFNGDGKDDIVWKGADGTISLWLMNGATPIDSATLLQGGSGWNVVGAPDLDGDGKADLLWRHSSGAVGGWLMNGLVSRDFRGWLDGGSCWSPVLTSEFNGDGKAEIVWRCTNGEYGAWSMNGLDIADVRTYGLAGSGWEAYR